jgi:hypothetical protein
MKKVWGRWQVDTDASVLTYSKDRALHIFMIPPGGRLTPAEVLDWITRSQLAASVLPEDLPDLTRAVADLLRLPPIGPVPNPG